MRHAALTRPFRFLVMSLGNRPMIFSGPLLADMKAELAAEAA